jgi:hypothetical protein
MRLCTDQRKEKEGWSALQAVSKNLSHDANNLRNQIPKKSPLSQSNSGSRANQAATSAILAIYYASGVGYWLEKAHDHVSVGKQTASGMTFLSCEPVSTGDTNKVLVLALKQARLKSEPAGD